MRRFLVVSFGMLVFVAGCGPQQSRGPSYTQQVIDRPNPTTDDDRARECLSIRQEMARQQGIGSYVAGSQSSPMMAAAVGVNTRQRMAALEQRAANIGCTAAFSPATAPSAKMGFEQCYSKCLELTGRTKEQCFDSCK